MLICLSFPPELDDAGKNIRGISKATLVSGSESVKFDRWTVQGTLGGETKFRDRVRGVMNEV